MTCSLDSWKVSESSVLCPLTWISTSEGPAIVPEKSYGNKKCDDKEEEEEEERHVSGLFGIAVK